MRRLCRRRGGGQAPYGSTNGSIPPSDRAARRDVRRGECAGSAGGEGAGKPPTDQRTGRYHRVIGPRDATCGGVNAPALPAERGRASPLRINERVDTTE